MTDIFQISYRSCHRITRRKAQGVRTFPPTDASILGFDLADLDEMIKFPTILAHELLVIPPGSLVGKEICRALTQFAKDQGITDDWGPIHVIRVDAITLVTNESNLTQEQ